MRSESQRALNDLSAHAFRMPSRQRILAVLPQQPGAAASALSHFAVTSVGPALKALRFSFFVIPSSSSARWNAVRRSRGQTSFSWRGLLFRMTWNARADVLHIAMHVRRVNVEFAFRTLLYVEKKHSPVFLAWRHQCLYLNSSWPRLANPLVLLAFAKCPPVVKTRWWRRYGVHSFSVNVWTFSHIIKSAVTDRQSGYLVYVYTVWPVQNIAAHHTVV